MPSGMHEQLKRMLSASPSSTSSSEAGTVCVVLDAVDDDLLGAEAQGGAAGVEGDVAAADDDDLLAHLDRLAHRRLVEQADGVEHVRRVGAGDRQRAAALQADGEVDGLCSRRRAGRRR